MVVPILVTLVRIYMNSKSSEYKGQIIIFKIKYLPINRQIYCFQVRQNSLSIELVKKNSSNALTAVSVLQFRPVKCIHLALFN